MKKNSKKRPIWEYYGQEERGKTKRLRPGDPRIETIDDLYEILFYHGWSAETAYPACQEDWDDEYPAYGQCAVTALLVYDLFGGEIRSKKHEYGSHYFNKIDGVIVDLTSEQGGGLDLSLYERSRKRYRNQCGQTGHTKKRYQLLVQRIADYLKNGDDPKETKELKKNDSGDEWEEVDKKWAIPKEGLIGYDS